MTITRVINGEFKTIELTKEEVYQAYRVQQEQFDILDADSALHNVNEWMEYPEEFIEAIREGLCEVAAERFRDNHDYTLPEDDQMAHIVEELLSEEFEIWCSKHPEFILEGEEIGG